MWTARNGVLTRQPSPSEQELNFGDPLARGLTFDLSSPMIGSNYRNLVDGKKPTKALGISRALQKYGSGVATPRANDNGLDFGVYQPITTYPFSILVVTDSASEGVITHLFSQRLGSSPYAQIDFILNARGDYLQQAGTLGLYTQDLTGTRNSPVTGASSVVTSGVHHYGVTDDGSNQRFYVDGFKVATIATVNGNSCFHTSQKLGIGRAADVTSNSETNARSQILTRVWNGRSLSEVDFKAQFDNPWDIYKSRRRIFAVGTASGGADLAGSAAAQASASGTISVQVPIVGAATVVATASGTLTTQSPLAGSATVGATATGGLSVTFALSGAALVNALAAGAISTSVALSGSALANALATGNLLAGGAGALAGNAAAQASASGSLSTAIPLQGAASALAVATGGLTTAFPLVGVAAAVSHVTGDLTVTFGGALSGNAVAQVLAAGALSIQVALSGSAVAHALATGILGSGDIPNTPQDTWDRALQALFEPFYGDFGESAVVAGIPVVGMFSSRAQDSFGIVQPSAAVLRMSATHVAAVGDTVTVGARTYQIAAIHDLDGSGTEKTLELK